MENKKIQENKKSLEKKQGYRLIKRRKTSTVMPEAKYDGAFFKENPYYIKIANKYRILKYVTILITVVFAIVMLTAYGTDITAENFQYLIKDLDITTVSSSRDFDKVIYNGGTSSSFGIYKNELVVVNSGSTMLYRPSGAQSFNKTNDYYNPKLLVSDKYFMVYDRGDTSCSYSIYNSFAELHSGSYEYPITLATICDNGAYALVTRDSSNRSVVYVYSKDFKLRNEIKKDKYVIGAAIKDDGSKIALASVYDSEGDYETELIVLNIGQEKPLFTVYEKGLMPLKAMWLSHDRICVLYTDCAIIYDSNGQRSSEISLGGMQSLVFTMGEDMFAAVYNTTVVGYDKTVNIYDKNADLIYSSNLQGELICAKINNSKLYLLFEQELIEIDPENKEVKKGSVEPNAKDVVFYSDTVVVCYSGFAVPCLLTKQ